ncbi:hypothetical protein Y1Q_0013587 [Alligator mississippiensis]|uniref:Uncharacterized protein n=1 Tax=Alligator mississippiensis TaxID=8496 RepID=A0A151P3B1_ALLMI|nr:hypothetical protein Y1Q_0013587 [Alligator mississippiensis]
MLNLQRAISTIQVYCTPHLTTYLLGVTTARRAGRKSAQSLNRIGEMKQCPFYVNRKKTAEEINSSHQKNCILIFPPLLKRGQKCKSEVSWNRKAIAQPVPILIMLQVVVSSVTDSQYFD